MAVETADSSVANDIEPLAKGGEGRVVQLARYRRRPAPKSAPQLSPGEISLSCRRYMVGREDWDRGFRVLFRSYDLASGARFDAEGGLHLVDFPDGELVLSAAEFQQCLRVGWEYRAAGLEVDVTAADFRALLPLKGGRRGLQLIASR
ncbi:hypothetical protein [Dongia sp.]|uniref:hypothetical protein n=1 Tax=Dongia sp. TaxID=1977262 RepID=UPI0035B2F4AA